MMDGWMDGWIWNWIDLLTDGYVMKTGTFKLVTICLYALINTVL